MSRHRDGGGGRGVVLTVALSAGGAGVVDEDEEGVRSKGSASLSRKSRFCCAGLMITHHRRLRVLRLNSSNYRHKLLYQFAQHRLLLQSRRHIRCRTAVVDVGEEEVVADEEYLVAEVSLYFSVLGHPLLIMSATATSLAQVLGVAVTPATGHSAEPTPVTTTTRPVRHLCA